MKLDEALWAGCAILATVAMLIFAWSCAVDSAVRAAVTFGFVK